MVRAGYCSAGFGYTLVIAEKPKAARKIAEALSDKPIACKLGGIPYWIVTWMGTRYVIVPAAGHLFGLTTDKHGFPVFEYYWAPLWAVDSSSAHTRRFLEAIKKLARHAVRFVNACDYDIEGSVIGYNILRALGVEKRALRAKFSALTRQDVRRAFSRLERLDWDMINAGLARHELDWLWGINISRALMESLRSVTGRSKVLSAGRVQSPTLVEAVSRTIKRNLFVPLPYFTVTATVELGGKARRLQVASFELRSEAQRVARQLRATGYLVVREYSEYVERIPPPYPFNLGDLQVEASRILGFSPYYTQKLAEELYLEGLISYPRTNSQKIPPTIDISAIVQALVRQTRYRELVEYLLRATRGVLRVNNGPKEDPAHPAIHPTGEPPHSGLSKNHLRLYDLIVRRFLASMAPPAVLVRARLILSAEGLGSASITGVRIVSPGWMQIYYWAKPSEEYIPRLYRGQRIQVKSVSVQTSYTQPPELHTKTSLVKWMESKGIGTEATRARIVELLFERGYLRSEGGRVQATELGLTVANILQTYFPDITSVELTRRFEELLEAIRMGKVSKDAVISEARRFLAGILSEFKVKSMHAVGMELAYSLGLLKPPRQCPICGRRAEGEYCSYHEAAIRKIVEAYHEWRRRTGITCREYLEKLAAMRSTGKWVREAAKYLLARNVCPKGLTA
ncbi:DNA topoisomerase I [Hyperthermus butylicus]|uniref:DNA topoisomerase n=1 Tax=Hyperthermus butylicus (strain DSM 5456 / JCM 9403 / PLM1-5) TaxID=415426 RepID=A2BLA3_HYPBU|nr:DNA topoisomerase I [Hyperthermus butylicus]ABM80764.1 DNA topoisomerase I [Hyperthermus butylicus DSM 5456]